MNVRLTILDDYQNVALGAADWSRVRERADIRVIPDHITDVDQLVAALENSEIVIAMRERTAFPASVLQRLPRLKLLVTTGMRNASIDLDAAHDRSVIVSGTAGGPSTVPELTLGMMIALTRHFVEEDRNIRDGGWQQTVGTGLAGRTLGILGLGRLGVPVAALAQAFGMQVSAWSRNMTAERAAEHGARAVNKEELFAGSDIVTIHLPLGRSSRGIVGADDLGRLGASGYLVNTSRGPIVDEAALIHALYNGTIAGAALDVYDAEPLPKDHPLRTAPNTLLLPHIGYVTSDVYAVYFREAVEDVLAYLDGAPIRVL